MYRAKGIALCICLALGALPAHPAAIGVPQEVTGAQATFDMSGCLMSLNGRLLLREPVSGVLEEVRGGGVGREVGNSVEITGSIVPDAKPAEGAREVVQVIRVRRLGGNCAPSSPRGVPGPQMPGKGSFDMSGCLMNLNGHLLLRDPVSGVLEEVRGGDAEKEIGNTVEINGSIISDAKPAERAQDVVQVSRVRRVGRNCAPTGP